MLDAILSFFDEFRRTFRVVDAIDISLVSVFLYAALVWFQKTASRGVLMGVAALTLVYFLARALDMYLTSLAFHTTFAVLLFVLVVVFQEDLRRLLERVSAFRSVRFGQTRRTSLDLDALATCVFEMAASRTGAIIVLKGKEPLERHVTGGVALDGRFSVQLLYSIFDSHTPGHDGAVIIEDNRITQFGVHLPISKNTLEVRGLGTRHSAAVGLSERSDALTVIASEERGVVSVAEAGKLKEMKTATELKQRLDEFFERAFPAAHQSPWRRHVLVQHMPLKIFAVVLAVIAWFVLAYDPHTVQRTFAAPIEYRNLPKEIVLDEIAPTEARVTLSGSERDFRFLDPGSLKISLDMSDAQSGFREIPVTERNIKLPANLSPYRIEPRIIRLFLLQQKPPATVKTPPANGTQKPSE